MSTYASTRSSPVVSSWIWIKVALNASVARHVYASTSSLVFSSSGVQKSRIPTKIILAPAIPPSRHVHSAGFCFHRSKLRRKVSSERVPKTCFWRQPVTVERNLTQVFRKDNWAWCKEWRYDCTMMGPSVSSTSRKTSLSSSLIVERWRAEHRYQLQCHAYERLEVSNIRKLNCADLSYAWNFRTAADLKAGVDWSGAWFLAEIHF